jgi:hypothetical protein
MTITSNQIQFFLSGGSSNSNPNLSLGGEISNTPVLGTLNNIFSDITTEQASSGRTDYRCVYIKNISVSDSLYDAGIYVYSQSSGGSTIEIGTSPTPVDTTAPSIAVDTLAPYDVTFEETSSGSRIILGDVGPESIVPVWIRRTTSPETDFKELDNFVLKITGKPFI